MHRTSFCRAACAAALALTSTLAAPASGQDGGAPPTPGTRTGAPPAGGVGAQVVQEDAARDGSAAEKAAAEKAARDARLLAEFERLTRELRDAVSRFQTELTALQQANTPREKWPPHPMAAHYTRFEELAMQDQPDALRWCLTAVGQIGASAPEVAERKAEIYARLVVVHPDQPWMADVARWLQADASPGGVGFERVDLLLATLADATAVPATRAAALGARAAILAPRVDPASRAEYQRILRELAEKHADTTHGQNAKGILFQAEYLVVGRTPPDVTGVDVDGRAFRLSEYRGKVVVLDFWGFWCGACVRSLPHLKELVQTHAQAPFALIGVATDRDLGEYQRRAREAGVTWRNVWAGGTSGAWPTSWGVQRYPTVYVLDAEGRIRYLDVRGEDLSRAVKTLLDEMRAPAGTPPR